MRLYLLLVGLIFIVTPTPASAHDDAMWIQEGGYRSKAGLLCCGPQDCHMLSASQVKITASGYAITIPGYTTVHGVIVNTYEEVIPYLDAQPSQDGYYWMCRWSQKTHCFFSPRVSN